MCVCARLVVTGNETIQLAKEKEIRFARRCRGCWLLARFSRIFLLACALSVLLCVEGCACVCVSAHLPADESETERRKKLRESEEKVIISAHCVSCLLGCLCVCSSEALLEHKVARARFYSGWSQHCYFFSLSLFAADADAAGNQAHVLWLLVLCVCFFKWT